jgi:hypothetical protein
MEFECPEDCTCIHKQDIQFLLELVTDIYDQEIDQTVSNDTLIRRLGMAKELLTGLRNECD